MRLHIICLLILIETVYQMTDNINTMCFMEHAQVYILSVKQSTKDKIMHIDKMWLHTNFYLAHAWINLTKSVTPFSTIHQHICVNFDTYMYSDTCILTWSTQLATLYKSLQRVCVQLTQKFIRTKTIWNW